MHQPCAPSPVVFLAMSLLAATASSMLAAHPAAADATPNTSLARQSEFDKTAAQYETRAKIQPSNPESWYTLAKLYSDKVQADSRLPRDVAKKYVLMGLNAEDKALAINPDYYEALSLKAVMLRQRAQYETEPAVRKKLIAEADVLLAKAAELLKKYKNGG